MIKEQDLFNKLRTKIKTNTCIKLNKEEVIVINKALSLLCTVENDLDKKEYEPHLNNLNNPEDTLSSKPQIVELLPKLNPSLFSLDKLEYKGWDMFNLTFIESLNSKLLQENIGEYAIGYCPSCELSVNPKKTGYALMFEKDKVSFWFNIDLWELEI